MGLHGFTWVYHMNQMWDVHMFETGRLIYVISRVAAWGPWTLETLEAAIPEFLLPNSWLLQRSRPSSACSSWNCAGTTLATDHERVEGTISVGKFIWSYWYILFCGPKLMWSYVKLGLVKFQSRQKNLRYQNDVYSFLLLCMYDVYISILSNWQNCCN